MKDIENQPLDAGTMPSGAAGEWKATRPIECESPMVRAVKLERGKLEACPAFRSPNTHAASGFFNWTGGNRRNNRREYPRKGVTLGVKRRNRIGFVPPFYGFLRLFTANGKKICAAGEPDGSQEEFCPAPE
jgi:hypothetical protein